MNQFYKTARKYPGEPGYGPDDDVKVGDLVIFRRRLAEVVETTTLRGRAEAARVEVTDGGGLKRQFSLHGPDDVTLLSTPSNQVLDGIVAATYQDEANPYYQKKLQTERWFADPRVGDLFHEMFSHWIKVDELPEDGSVVISYTVKFEQNTGWTWAQKTYANRDEFRAKYRYSDHPGYTVLAHSSRRGGEEPAMDPR